MSIASDFIRGNTDMVILAQLLHKDSYGYEINKNIQEKSSKQFILKEATLYGAFRRLEEAGYVSYYWGDENVGARRRYYRITNSGRLAYYKMLKDWQEASKLIEAMIHFAEGETGND
jgi:Predicted transcriptional regulators